MSEPVSVLRSGAVLEITIDRPEVRNAVDLPTAHAIADAMELFESDAELSVAIITGAGGTFSAGMDLRAFGRGERPSIPGKGFAGFVEAQPSKVTIAAVEGYALAGGFEIALACDLIVAAEDAVFGLPEVKRGLVAAGGGLLRLPRRIPSQIALEIALTGEPLTAPRALELGLVNRIAPAGGALVEARALALSIAANGPLAVAATKRVVADSRLWESDDEFSRQREITEPVFLSSDAREGALAFREKRTPKWSGS
jgi:enoyl-CoA hydratase